jgi:hypothetical protein
MRKLQAARCDPREIAHYIFNFVLNRQNPVLAERRAHRRIIRRKLLDGIEGARKAAEAYRVLADAYPRIEGGVLQSAAELQQTMNVNAMLHESERLERTASDLQSKLTACRDLSDERHFGQAGFWMWLVMLQEYARAKGSDIQYGVLGEFITAARFALRRKYEGQDNNGRKYVDVELLGKGIEHFRDRNQLVVSQIERRLRSNQSAKNPETKHL